MKEVFVPVKGFKNYTVSNYGRVYSRKSNIFLKQHKTNPNSNWYVSLHKNNKHKAFNVATLVYKHFHKVKKNRKYAIHLDLDRDNNFERNLDGGTWGDMLREAHRIKNKRRGVYSFKMKQPNGSVYECYRALVRYKGKNITLGYTKTKQEAEQIYYAGYHELYGRYPYEVQ